MDRTTSRRGRAAFVAACLIAALTWASPTAAAEGPTLSVGEQSGLERDLVTGSVFVPVYLSEPATEPVVVSYWTSDGSAVAGSDYTRWGTPSAPRTVTIPAGSVQTTVNVPVLADDELEQDETFTVTVGAVTGGGALIGDPEGTATIVDPDGVGGPNPAITVSEPTVVEGDQGTRRAQFHIHLSRAPSTNVSITYTTVDGSAAAGTDYTAKLPGSVVFAPGQISKTLDVVVAADTAAEDTSQFSLDVSVTGGSPVEELSMSASASIVDDDADAVAPAVTVPGSLRVDATTPAGAAVSYEVSAVDAVDGDVPATCSTPSGATFPIGITQVTCTAEDASGNAGSATFSVTVETRAVAVGISANNTCAVVRGGAAWCWGSNLNGQLGDGTNTASSVPVAVSGLNDATSIDLGFLHACAIVGAGGVKCWGTGVNGRLGNGGTTGSKVPVDVLGITDATDLALENSHSCALLGSGSIKCWGRNSAGLLGDGTSLDASTPVTVSGITDAVALSTGSLHSCAILADTSVRCWGYNGYGALGNGTTTNSSTPVAVPGITGAIAISAGGSHTCVVLDDGSVRCWGRANEGQLGHGGPGFQSTSPVTVAGVADVVEVEAVNYHTCVRRESGAISCWGLNDRGQLGNGTTTGSPTPVDGPLIAGVAQMWGSYDHICTMTTAGTLSCWGRNGSGQLGDGSQVDRTSPVGVVSLD